MDRYKHEKTLHDHVGFILERLQSYLFDAITRMRYGQKVISADKDLLEKPSL